MRRFSALFFAGVILISLCGCGGGGSSIGPITVSFSTFPGTVAGGATFVFSVTTQNDTGNRGVNFTLALNAPSNGQTTTPCTTACGALTGQSNVVTASGPDTFTTTTTVNYNAPLLPPTPNNLILTATSATDSSTTATATFTIGAPQVTVRITNKITNIQPGAAPVMLNAQVQFDNNNAGVTWALTAQGASCSPACGSLSNVQKFTVVYAPPPSLPSAPNNTPTITATSVTDTTRTDFDDIRIQAPTQPISVSITNPFAQIAAGSAGVTINAVVANDVAGQGVSWSLEPAAQTGALSAVQPSSVVYTPPNTAPQPPNDTPTVIATSVADPTKSAQFTFTIEVAQAEFRGAYIFWVLASDGLKNSQVMAGSLVADGAGKISAGELDVNYNDSRGVRLVAPLSGTYSVTRTPKDPTGITIILEDVATPGPNPRHPLRFTTSSDGSSSEFSDTDGPWTITSGIVRRDSPALGFTEFISSSYSFFLQDDPSKQATQVGRLTLSANGGVLSGSTTLSVPGVVPSSQEIRSGILGGFDSHGRGTLTLSFDDGTTHHFVSYAADDRLIFLIGSDEKPKLGNATRIDHRGP